MNIESIHAIQRLMNEYCYHVDSGDFDAMAALFEHATFQFIGDDDSALSGVEEMRAMLNSVTLYDGKPHTKHLMSNVQIDIDESDERAEAQCYIAVFQAIPEKFPLQPIFIGCYHDQFERVDSEWRFKQRLISPDLIGDLAFHRADMT